MFNKQNMIELDLIEERDECPMSNIEYPANFTLLSDRRKY